MYTLSILKRKRVLKEDQPYMVLLICCQTLGARKQMNNGDDRCHTLCKGYKLRRSGDKDQGNKVPTL